jgi:hypothetical protein
MMRPKRIVLKETINPRDASQVSKMKIETW